MINFECTISRSPDAMRFVESLTEVIQSRWHVERSDMARLQSVRIFIGQLFCDAAKEDLCRLIDCLRKFRAEGLSVYVFKFRGELWRFVVIDQVSSMFSRVEL